MLIASPPTVKLDARLPPLFVQKITATICLVSVYSTQPTQTQPLGVVDSLTLVRPLSGERGDVSGARVFMGGYSTCRGCRYQFLSHI